MRTKTQYFCVPLMMNNLLCVLSRITYLFKDQVHTIGQYFPMAFHLALIYLHFFTLTETDLCHTQLSKTYWVNVLVSRTL